MVRGTASMWRFLLALTTALFLFFLSARARADKVVVLPFDAPKGGTKPELDQVRKWATEAVIARKHGLPTAAELAAAEAAVRDGLPDTSSEYKAAGKAAAAQWTIGGHAERRDVAPVKLPDGKEEEGYTQWRLEVEVCQVDTGRVESLVREIDPDEAPAQIAEMLALLIRPEGIGNSPIPWDPSPHKPKIRQKPPEPPPPPPPPAPPPEPEKPAVAHPYAENRPAALGVAFGYSGAIDRPDGARGPSSAFAIGGVGAYAFEQLPGLEARAAFTSQVVGPKAFTLAAGARYALPIVPKHRIFLGPEALLGVHVALGADKTARFLLQGSAFVAWGITEMLQVEVAGDLTPAFGGSGTLVLGGATGRVLLRF